MVTCPACEGKGPPEGSHGGCKLCGGEGELVIPHCPGREVDAATRQVVRLCGFARKGALPVAGGVLDQTQAFLDVLAFYEAERAELMAKKDPLGLGER